MASASAAMAVAEKTRLWIALLQRRPLRAVAHQPFFARQFEIEERLQVLSVASRPTYRNTGGRSFAGGVSRRDGTVRYRRPCATAAGAGSARRRTRRAGAGAHQHRPARPMEGAQEGIAPGQRQPRTAVTQVFGKARMDRRGEVQAALAQPCRAAPAERPLGGQVHGIRGEGLDQPAEAPEVPGQGISG